jgi:DNA-binding NarL/FixJ family response regulator
MRESFTYTVADQDDVEIVGQAEEVAEIPDLVEETRPDCVIISPEKPGDRVNAVE